MSQIIHCQSCDTNTRVATIAELIHEHTDDVGRFRCEQCGATDTFVERKKRPPAGRGDRWIKGVLPIATKTGNAGHSPFVFLTADTPDGDVSGIEFKFYRNGKATRPVGGAVFTQGQLLTLVGQLARIGVLTAPEWRNFLKDLNGPPKTRA